MARFAFERVLERDPDLAHAHWMLGSTLLHLEEPRLARARYERACELAPQAAGNWADLARLDLELEDLDCAGVALDMALEQAPGDADLLQLQRDIQAAR
jgi:tetratricopeptide (TPR) repeat protein